MNIEFNIPTKILFGVGKLEDLKKESLPGNKALIVISSGNSMRRNGYLSRLEEILKSKDIDFIVYDKIMPNPIKKHVMEGAKIAKEENCDFVIGLGGGSSIDSAKSIALMVRNTGDYWDYVSGGTGKNLPIKDGALPIVAIPTTAGTGTEADPWTVITNEITSEKIGFGNQYTFPSLSIVDPELMISIPEHLTAYQGFDALFHAMEGYLANISNPFSDIFALKSIELIFRYLPICVKEGNNIEARTKLALASTFSGIVETLSSCTSEHSMEHALSALYPKLPHGAGLIMLSESYYTFFASKVPKKFREMAKAMGINIDPLSDEKCALMSIERLVELQEICNVRDLKMSSYGISKDEIKDLALNARKTMGGLFELDPYKLSLEETIEIMQNAYK